MQTINSSHPEFQDFDCKDYIIDSELAGMRKGGRFNNSTILTYEDGTEWIFLNNKAEERFCGFLFLQDALKQSKVDGVGAAANKMAMHNGSIIYLSKYCGETKPDYLESLKKINYIKTNAGFTDLTGCANLREVEGTIYIFDTEKGSFDPRVRDAIDQYLPLHNAIKASLEEKLK
jgi:hypothetical protein